MICDRCGLPKGEGDVRCACRPRGYSMRLEPAAVSIVGQPVGHVIEGPPDDPKGRRVNARPASGGEADSVLGSDGSFTVHLAGALERGRSGEARATKVLIQAMRALGRTVERLGSARDDRGEDEMLLVDGKQTPLQCVSVPVDPTKWAELARQGQVQFEGTIDDAVALVRDALEHKRDRARGTLLVIDMAQLGAVVTPRLVRAYRAAYPDPQPEFHVLEAWLVGPTTRSTQRLSGEVESPPS